MTKLLVVLVLIVMALPVLSVDAQEPTPEPGPQASRLLPEADEFGDGWRLTQIVSPDLLARYRFEMTPDVFREGAAGIYVGPNGSRVILVSLLITENRVAIRQSWEDAGALLSAVESGISTDYERGVVLETMSAPPECAEAKRTEGIENLALLPTGATMCAVDPDGITIAIVFGDLDGETGVAASDAVIGFALGSEEVSGTPDD